MYDERGERAVSAQKNWGESPSSIPTHPSGILRRTAEQYRVDYRPANSPVTAGTRGLLFVVLTGLDVYSPGWSTVVRVSVGV